MSEIKPCPFCGSSASVKTGGFGEKAVSCDNKRCGISFDGGIWFTTKGHAIDLWNKQTIRTKNERLKEQLKKAVDVVEMLKHSIVLTKYTAEVVKIANDFIKSLQEKVE